MVGSAATSVRKEERNVAERNCGDERKLPQDEATAALDEVKAQEEATETKHMALREKEETSSSLRRARHSTSFHSSKRRMACLLKLIVPFFLF